jgi:hypothetical protein
MQLYGCTCMVRSLALLRFQVAAALLKLFVPVDTSQEVLLSAKLAASVHRYAWRAGGF